MKKILSLLLLMPFLLINVSATYNKESSYIVLESSSLRVLEEKNSNTQFLIASTAKILTAITTIENYDLNEEIVVSKKDVNEVGSKVYLKENEKIKRVDLLYALMLRSANDAASALSNNNSEVFIKQMNETAKKIGMKNSVFANASGLDEREYNLSTAYDMAILSAYAAKNEVFMTISGSHSHGCQSSETNYTWYNKHKLVKNDDLFIWGKTGYTKKSGRILVSNYQKKEMNLIVVTINDSNDWNHHRQLVEQLDTYDFITIFKKGIYDTKLDVTYYIYVEEDIVIPIKSNENEDIRLEFKLLSNKAYVDVYLNNVLVLKKYLDVYDKSNFDIDLVIDLFK